MGLARQVSRLPLTALSLGLEAWERSAGLREFARRRGNEALQIAAHTPLGRLLPQLVLDDDADAEAARITAAVRTTESTEPVRAPDPVRAARTPQTAPAVHVPEPETRADLPITDFDNITLGSLRARLRNLSVEQLVLLREWEQAHAHRLPVLTTLDNRIAKLGASDAYPRGEGESTAPTRPS